MINDGSRQSIARSLPMRLFPAHRCQEPVFQTPGSHHTRCSAACSDKSTSVGVKLKNQTAISSDKGRKHSGFTLEQTTNICADWLALCGRFSAAGNSKNLYTNIGANFLPRLPCNYLSTRYVLQWEKKVRH